MAYGKTVHAGAHVGLVARVVELVSAAVSLTEGPPAELTRMTSWSSVYAMRPVGPQLGPYASGEPCTTVTMRPVSHGAGSDAKG